MLSALSLVNTSLYALQSFISLSIWQTPLAFWGERRRRRGERRRRRDEGKEITSNSVFFRWVSTNDHLLPLGRVFGLTATTESEQNSLRVPSGKSQGKTSSSLMTDSITCLFGKTDVTKTSYYNYNLRRIQFSADYHVQIAEVSDISYLKHGIWAVLV